ncbi:MAG: NAD(P)-dependent alcohol dehydrogenase [Actinomycetes bacterium]
MTTTRSLVVSAPGAKFASQDVELLPVKGYRLRIEIEYSGICHSDIHQARNEWFEGIFPMVPGHEIVGRVVEIGPKVTRFALGDLVGVGTFVDSCRKCEYCLDGRENYCLAGNVQTYNGRHYDGTPTYGGYAKQIVVDENYVLRVPDTLDPAGAAPLLCAGITVFSPLRHWQAGPGKRVAILGFGGLGHLAVKFAAAMGAEVIVLGHTKTKKADAKKFGAVDYMTIAEAQKVHQNYFDIILNTTSANLDVDALLRLLHVGGSLVNVGLPGESQSYNPFGLVTGLKSIAGSNTGGIDETQLMLDFAAVYNITAKYELVDATRAKAIDAAYDRVVASDVRYRFVIDGSTI